MEIKLRHQASAFIKTKFREREFKCVTCWWNVFSTNDFKWVKGWWKYLVGFFSETLNYGNVYQSKLSQINPARKFSIPLSWLHNFLEKYRCYMLQYLQSLKHCRWCWSLRSRLVRERDKWKCWRNQTIYNIFLCLRPIIKIKAIWYHIRTKMWTNQNWSFSYSLLDSQNVLLILPPHYIFSKKMK